MEAKAKQDEELYLEYVKINIELEREDITRLLKDSAVGGAGPKSGRNIAESLIRKKDELPSEKEPYFVRVDLIDGETLYYGFGTLSKASASPQIPTSHGGVDYFLTYHRNNDGVGRSVLPISDFPDVVRRIRFHIKNGKITKIDEEVNTGVKAIRPKVLAKEQLEDVITSTRSDSLQPVGATLQPDQFKLIREKTNTILTIQGPPGSGKTVVLLERLSRIAFADPATKKKGMLLIGPNQQFLEYVRDALEILGNSDIIMSTPEDLTSWKASQEVDTDGVQYLKGFDQITLVIDNYFKNTPSVLDDSYKIKIGDIEVEFTVLDSLDIIAILKNENLIYSQLRLRAGVMVSNLLTERFFKFWEDKGKQRRQYEGDPIKAIQATSTYRTIIRNMYPELTPEIVLKDLKKSAKTFIASARSIFEEEDIREWLTNVIPHPFDIRVDDIPLLDYIRYKIQGTDEVWGHIAIDEAQDLTPMQLTMLRRRTDAASSISLTGDLAQATGVVVYETWPAITNYLSDEEPLQEKLTRSYRVPKEILKYANQFLELSEVQVEPAEPFLEKPDSLILQFPFEEAGGMKEAEALIANYLINERSVLLVANSKTVQLFRVKEFETRGKAHFKAYLAQDVKGLEFDVVIILNAGDVLSELLYESSKAARLMYVLTTRSTQFLHVIGRNSLEVKKPIQYYEAMDLSDEEIGIMFEDLKIELPEIQELTPAEPGSLAYSNSSVPALCEDFNMIISTTDPNLLESGWFYVGLTQSTRCISCNFKQQQVFRRHQNVSNKISHPGAFVCLGCLVARLSTNYNSQVLLDVDKELIHETTIEKLCLDCSK
jgi:hypothetical protein